MGNQLTELPEEVRLHFFFLEDASRKVFGVFGMQFCCFLCVFILGFGWFWAFWGLQGLRFGPGCFYPPCS